MSEKIFITGATGNVGSQVIRYLRKQDIPLICSKLTHKETKDENGLEYRVFDFTQSITWEECLRGVSRVFLMRPPHISNIKRDMYPFMRYLKEIDIKHVVFLSVQGAEGSRMIPHNKVEKYCKELELPYTFVRPSFFMQNLTTTHLPEIRDEKILFVPAGSGKTNFIDVRDIGEVIARLLLDSRHIEKAYTITGEKSYSYDEVASALTSVLGEEIRYVNPDFLRFIIYHWKRKRKLAMTLVMLALYSIVKLGKADITTKTTEELLGRKPGSLESFISDYRGLLKGDTGESR